MGCSPYFEEDFFEEPPLDEDDEDLRAEVFADDFFAPPLAAPELDRDVLDFFAPPDLEAPPDLDDPDFDELFLLVAGDLAIADVLSFPSKKGTGIASPAVVKKPPSDHPRLIAGK